MLELPKPKFHAQFDDPTPAPRPNNSREMVMALLCRSAAALSPPPPALRLRCCYRRLSLHLPRPTGHGLHTATTARLSFSSSSSTMETPPPGYRRNVGICLMNPSTNKIFAAARLDIPGSWQMPQGGIDKDEDPRNAALRELREETGVASAEILSEVPYWLTYDFPPDVRAKLNRQWGSDWKGQAQKWFLIKFTGGDDEVNLFGDGTEKPEFGEWSWMTPQEVIERVIEFKKPVYEEIFRFFSTHLGQR